MGVGKGASTLRTSRTPSRLGYKWWAYFAIAVGLFASVSDHGSVAVALPTISQHFGIDLPTAQWVVVGYALTISALILPMGRLSDVVGRKRVYVWGFSLFVASALMAGMATGIVALILSRALMGVGAAMTQGTAMAMVVSAFPASERGKALGMQISAVGLGAIAGPALGGIVVSSLGWRAVFFATALLGAVAIVAAQTLLDEKRDGRAERGDRSGFDWIGAVLSAVILVTFLLTMTNGTKIGWGSSPIAVAFLVLAALLGTFAWWELRNDNPMLDVRTFRQASFSLGVAARFASFVGLSSVRFLMPFYLQAVLGYRPHQIGLIVVPSALAMTLTGPLGGRLSDRYGWRILTTLGLLASSAGLLVLSRISQDTPLGLVVAAMVVQSAGFGVFGAPNSSSVLSAVEPATYGVVSGFLNLVRNSANVTGIALATAIVTAIIASEGVSPTLGAVSGSYDVELVTAFVSGLRTAFLVTGGLVIVGAVLSSLNADRPGNWQTERAEETRPPGVRGGP